MTKTRVPDLETCRENVRKAYEELLRKMEDLMAKETK